MTTQQIIVLKLLIDDNSLSKKDYQTENPEELYKRRVGILKSELDKHINN
jgi:hypothetical protein